MPKVPNICDCPYTTDKSLAVIGTSISFVIFMPLTPFGNVKGLDTVTLFDALLLKLLFNELNINKMYSISQTNGTIYLYCSGDSWTSLYIDNGTTTTIIVT